MFSKSRRGHHDFLLYIIWLLLFSLLLLTNSNLPVTSSAAKYLQENTLAKVPKKRDVKPATAVAVSKGKNITKQKGIYLTKPSEENVFK